MKVTVDIKKCYGSCPHFLKEIGGILICKHKDAPDSGYIIVHPQCDVGFPVMCPLKKVEGTYV